MAIGDRMARRPSEHSFHQDFLGLSKMHGPDASDHGKSGGGINITEALVSGDGRQFIGYMIDKRKTEVFQSLKSFPVLWQAYYDSYANKDQDYCYDGTRQNLLERLVTEITAPGAAEIILIKGPAGFGKSAIAKTICSRLDVPKLGSEGAGSLPPEFQLGGSYFFRNSDSERSNINKFIITIAAQLATNIKGFQSCIASYEAEELIEMNSMELFKKLIEEPCKPLSKPRIAIIVDALDECKTSVDDILKILSRFRNIASICARVVFTSRPIPLLEAKGGQFRTVNLDDDGIVRASREDISIFVDKKFQEMRPSGATDGVQWPSKEDFNRAIYLATNPKPLFIYAVAMCRFIGEPYSDPRYRLHQWLEKNEHINLTSLDSASQLPSMYRSIFNQVESRGLDPVDLQSLRLILHSVCAIGAELSTSELLQLLGCDKMDHELLLLRRNMQPILDIPEDMDLDSPLQIYHKSLLDFLQHSKYEGCIFYPIDEKFSGLELGGKSLALMSKLLSHKGGKDGDYDKTVADYAFRNWATFLTTYDGQISDNPGVLQRLQHFLTHEFLAAFELLDAMRMEDVERLEEMLLNPLKRLRETQKDPSLKINLKDAISFVEEMHDAGIYPSVYEAYQSALVFSSTTPFYIQNARLWEQPIASCQTYKLQDCSEEGFPSPVSFHFSRSSTVFVGLFSDNTIRRWNRILGDTGIGPQWNFQSMCRCTLALPASRPHGCKTTTLSADGNYVAYVTTTGIEIWNTQSPRERHLPHLTASKIRSLAFSEDGTHLAVCHEPGKDGIAQVVTWKLYDVGSVERFPFYPLVIVELLTSAWETLLSYLPWLTQIFPSHCDIQYFRPMEDTLGGIAFSPSGDKLAVLSFSDLANEGGFFGGRVLALQTWNTKPGKSMPYSNGKETFEKREIFDDMLGPGMECLNMTFLDENSVAILWRTDLFIVPDDWNVELWWLNDTDTLPLPLVHYPSKCKSSYSAKVEPEPFWLGNDSRSVHASHGWFNMSQDSGEFEGSGFIATNPDAEIPSHIIVQGTGRRYPDDRLLVPRRYAWGLSACSQHTFVRSDTNNGDLKFIEFIGQEQEGSSGEDSWEEGSLEGHEQA